LAQALIRIVNVRRSEYMAIVLELFASRARRFVAVLCAALMLLYAGAVPAKALNNIQHASSATIGHEHVAPGTLSFDAVHERHDAHHDHGDEAGREQPGDPLAGGPHHHHGDNGASLIFPSLARHLDIDFSGKMHGFRTDRPIAGLGALGQERPPRTPLNA